VKRRTVSSRDYEAREKLEKELERRRSVAVKRKLRKGSHEGEEKRG